MESSILLFLPPSKFQNSKFLNSIFLRANALKFDFVFPSIWIWNIWICLYWCGNLWTFLFEVTFSSWKIFCSVHQITFWSANFTLQPVMIVVLMVMLRCPILQRNETYSVLQGDYLFLGNTLGPSECCCLRCKARVEIRNGNNNLKSKQKHSSRRD